MLSTEMEAAPEWLPAWFWYQHQTIGQQDLPALKIHIDIKFFKWKHLIITKFGNFKRRAHVKLMRFPKTKFKVLHLDWGNPQCHYRLEDEYHKEESKRLFEIKFSDLLCSFSFTYCHLPGCLYNGRRSIRCVQIMICTDFSIRSSHSVPGKMCCSGEW